MGFRWGENNVDLVESQDIQRRFGCAKQSNYFIYVPYASDYPTYSTTTRYIYEYVYIIYLNILIKQKSSDWKILIASFVVSKKKRQKREAQKKTENKKKIARRSGRVMYIIKYDFFSLLFCPMLKMYYICVEYEGRRR